MGTIRTESIALSLLATSLVVLQSIPHPACARGGGGGGRGGGGFHGSFGGNFGRGDFGRGFDRDFDRAADRAPWTGAGGRGFSDTRSDRDAFNNRPQVSEADLRAGANQEYHWSSLPTDSGLSRATGQVSASLSHVTRSVSPAGMAARAQAVRGSFHHYDAFNRDFWNRYRGAWWYPWWGNYWPWGYTGWGDLCDFWDEPEADEPVEYDYGNNITYQDDTVYYGNQPMESSDAYYDQAQSLALSTTPSTPPEIPEASTTSATTSKSTKQTGKSGDWKPLGVFALTQGDQTDSNSIFQLAVNKAGIVRGNYYNPLTEEEKPLQGKVDKKSKRVAWTVGSNKDVVYDTGLANLLSQQSSLLIHVGRATTQQWNIVRLKHDQG